MPEIKNEGIFKYVVNYSDLMIEITSDKELLLKLDFIKDNKQIKNSDIITDPIRKTVSYLDDYFHGNKSKIEIVLNTGLPDKFTGTSDILFLDMTGYTEKEISIYRELLNVESGITISYSDLALRSGIIRGARFAGNCMAGNRFPIIIPCHRVIGANGKLTGYGEKID